MHSLLLVPLVFGLIFVGVAPVVSAGPPQVVHVCTQFTDADCPGSVCYRILNTPDVCVRRV